MWRAWFGTGLEQDGKLKKLIGLLSEIVCGPVFTMFHSTGLCVSPDQAYTEERNFEEGHAALHRSWQTPEEMDDERARTRLLCRRDSCCP